MVCLLCLCTGSGLLAGLLAGLPLRLLSKETPATAAARALLLGFLAGVTGLGLVVLEKARLAPLKAAATSAEGEGANRGSEVWRVMAKTTAWRDKPRHKAPRARMSKK